MAESSQAVAEDYASRIQDPTLRSGYEAHSNSFDDVVIASAMRIDVDAARRDIGENDYPILLGACLSVFQRLTAGRLKLDYRTDPTMLVGLEPLGRPWVP